MPGCFILEASSVWSSNTFVVGSFPARCFMKSILRRRLLLLYSFCGRQIGAISLLAANQFQPGYKLMQSDKSYSSLLLGSTLYAILHCYRDIDDKSAKIEFVAAYQTGNKVPCCFHPLNWLYWHARQKNAFSRKKVLEVKEGREGETCIAGCFRNMTLVVLRPCIRSSSSSWVEPQLLRIWRRVKTRPFDRASHEPVRSNPSGKNAKATN